MMGTGRSGEAADPWLSRLGLWAVRLMARCPLPVVRWLGGVLGGVLHLIARRRVRIARTNWQLCFPEDRPDQVRAGVRRHFTCFVQAWLDRGWLWHASPAVLQRRLRFTGDLSLLQDHRPVVLFAPHFVGLDAGWTALTLLSDRSMVSLYARQLNPVVDQWIRAGRLRFGDATLLPRGDGLRPLATAVRRGQPLYLLPDMDYGPDDSLFVPFFGVPAATIASLPRFAQLGRADVRMVVVRLTDAGYQVDIGPVWPGYPTSDLQADTHTMNQRLEQVIRTMPEQYFWVHKRFKTRPEGAAPIYTG